MEWDPVFLSYQTLLRLLCCFISGYALETRSVRDFGLSFAHDTRVLHMIIRSLTSPSVYSFSHLDPDSGFAQTYIENCTSTHAHITLSSSTSPLIFRGCAFSDLVSLTNRIYSSLASPLILGRLAPSSLASPTNRVKHRLSDTRLSPSIPVPHWHFRGGGFGLTLLVRKKSATVTRNI